MREWGLGKFQVFVLSDLKKQVLVQHLLIRRVVQAVVVQIYVVQESSAVEGLHIFGYWQQTVAELYPHLLQLSGSHL